MTAARPEKPIPSLPPSALPRSVIAAVTRLSGSHAPVSAYVYRPEVAAARAARLREALPAWAEIFYAVKANAFPPVLRALAGVVEGFEVASQEESELAAAAMSAHDVRPRLVASGPGKTESNLRRLLELGVEAINVESMLELRRAARLAQERGTRVNVMLRINPRPVRVAPTICLGGSATPFGIDEDQVEEALAAASDMPSVGVIGFHFHLVCNILDPQAHAAYVRWCVEWSARAALRDDVDLHVVDVGGGLGVPERPQEEEMDLDVLAESLAALRPPSGTRVIFEPGRWLVDDCGYYAAEVTDVKHTNGTWFAVLRGGIHHFMRPAAYGTPHNFAVIPRGWPYAFPRPEVRDAPVTVVGELCTPADVLAAAVPVERLRAGDVVVFPRAGSYGWEMSIQRFLGHPHAARVVAPGDSSLRPIRTRDLERG